LVAVLDIVVSTAVLAAAIGMLIRFLPARVAAPMGRGLRPTLRLRITTRLPQSIPKRRAPRDAPPRKAFGRRAWAARERGSDLEAFSVKRGEPRGALYPSGSLEQLRLGKGDRGRKIKIPEAEAAGLGQRQRSAHPRVAHR
jgi:hypothetical protein